MKCIKFIDLFAGIGGFRYGLENTQHAHIGKKPEQEERKQGRKRTTDERQVQLRSRNGSTSFRCVYSNEWDKYAAQIYKKHYGECDTRDIRTVASCEIPDFDLLVGGFPCQAFSIAGKRKGFDDTRGTLFFEIARILADKRPRYFILENVKGLLSHDEGKTFQTILGVLTDLGYEYQWQVLNSKNFGVPQNRERVFIVGNLRGTPRPKVFPITGNNQENNEVHKRERKVASTINTSIGRNQSDGQYVVEQLQAFRVRSIDGVSSTLQGEAGGTGAKTGLYAIPVLTPDRLKKRQNGRRFKTDGEPSFTLTGQDIHGVSDGMKIRRLTPTECERLQGFEDGWTEGVSDTQRYKMLGNAVTTNVVQWIGERLGKESAV